MSKNIFWSGIFLCLSAFVGSCQSPPKQNIATGPLYTIPTGNNEARQLAEQIYAFGYPLVIMDVTRDMMTHSAYPTDTTAPLNQFLHRKTFPDASTTDVASPNTDTLYSSAWLDLSREPVVVSLPEMGRRYYLMQMMSAWTEVFANPGTRTTGNNRQNFAIIGPNWRGTLPVGVREIKSPTNDVWIIGRTQTNGNKDFSNVHQLQKNFKITPLSSWGTDYMPPNSTTLKEGVNLSQTPVDQVEALSGLDFFAKMADSMKRNPPLQQDALMVEKMRRIGMMPGQSFNPLQLSPDLRNALNEGARSALTKIINAAKNPKVEKVDGWVYNFNMGAYGTNYDHRAAIALAALGASLPQDIVYLRSYQDSFGRRLNGRYKYVLHFPKAKLPPANAFWSVTIYNQKNYFVKNPLNRYDLGDGDRFTYNLDGSLDIYIQYQPPEQRRISNWLPAPPGNFNLITRLYWPRNSVLDRLWRMPGVQRVEELKQLSLKDGLLE
ncbi:MAG TPA: DUF1254 domain-containing protein [Bdellovibrio sp.]|nr:DUF1254 domain-containing protein [Bdellovibrio sp.]